jgi:dTDP-glucose 4,6-dehydratase
LNILITGCAGFIGSHATEEFLSHGHTVVGLDSMTYAASLDNLAEIHGQESFIFYIGDICDTNIVESIVKKHEIEWIVNFAAETHVDNSIQNCDSFIKTNIGGVNSILSVCKDHDINLLHISTDEVYGSIDNGSFFEEDEMSPKNPYSATKAAAEHMINAYSNTYGTNHITVRMSNNFGPRQHKEKFIPTIISKLMKGEKIPVYGDGKNVRDWFYVKDCAKMVYSVFKNGKIGEVYNLTHHNEMTNLDVVDIICRVCEKDPEENIVFVSDRLGHDFRYSISNKKVTSIGIADPSDFFKSIQETVSSWRNKDDI